MAIDVVPTVLYSGMLGVVISALVQATSKPKHKQTMYLSGLLVLLIIHILGELYIYSGAYRFAPGLAGFQLPIRMLLGPALYFYAYAAMSADCKRSVRSYLTALLGPLVVIVAMLPFVFAMTAEQKLALADPATRDPELWQIAIYTCLFSAVAFIFFTFAYLFAALKLHAQHRKQLMDKYSAIEKRSMDWFRVVLILWGLAWLVYATNYAATFIGVRWFAVATLLPLFELLILIAFTHLALNQSELRESEKGITQQTQQRTTVIPPEKMHQIAEKLSATMAEKQLYRDDELSLNSLSTSIAVSENYISETLSQFLNTNFFQFVNSYRVEEAKKLLMDSDMLVSTIAYEVGFKSKSTFNSAFKKIVGTTPTAFKKAPQI
ncbi:helix-turn-helix transcriptional regulator [Thalassotalea sp. Y01]|uniref:helix-turn-helix domain-containing protein n=1 Tax=Thalassotalea sp. Y01 TaxID=2729613 RepID=UPI00145E44F7|nr:helix-turn-helix transcriptional regulator [Thalassotalea sp. Y01]NMP17288.1 helix-turn-helix transcriptional regulator [Thalassotalea sp. Y01]